MQLHKQHSVSVHLYTCLYVCTIWVYNDVDHLITGWAKNRTIIFVGTDRRTVVFGTGLAPISATTTQKLWSKSVAQPGSEVRVGTGGLGDCPLAGPTRWDSGGDSLQLSTAFAESVLHLPYPKKTSDLRESHDPTRARLRYWSRSNATCNLFMHTDLMQ